MLKKLRLRLPCKAIVNMIAQGGLTIGLSTCAIIVCLGLGFILPQNSTYTADEPSIDPGTLLTKTEVEKIEGSRVFLPAGRKGCEFAVSNLR
jgi:hypothetical protein